MASKYPILETYGFSDIGTTRLTNEDVCLSLGNFFHVLADGIGGHNAGEIAANTAVKQLCKAAKKNLSQPLSKKQIEQKIKKAVQKTNYKIYKLGCNFTPYKGLGTTLCCLYFWLNFLIYTHLGDSRIYLLRNNSLRQLTQDHSPLNKKNEQCKNIITQAVGIRKTVNPIIKTKKLHEGDVVVMCSDGLSKYVPNREIKNTITHSQTPKDSVEQLINIAKKKGSNDNITVLMVKVKSIYEKPNISR